MEIRFAIIPPAKVTSMAATLARQYASRHPHRFVVDDRKYLPHITLFKINVHKRYYPQVLAMVRHSLRQMHPLNLVISERYPSPGGWVSLAIKSSPQLLKLQQKLAQAMESSGHANKITLKAKYRPHITLTRFYTTAKAAEVAQEKLSGRVKFSATDIGLCLSRQTQVYKILDKVKLK